LVIIDGHAGAPESDVPAEEAAAVMTALFARDLAARSGEEAETPDEALAHLGPDELLQHLLDEGRRGAAETPGPEQSRMHAWRRVFAHNVRANARYRPAPYAGPITLMRSSDEGKDPLEQELSWKRLAGEGVEVQDLPGDHHSLLRAPHVRLLAQRLTECLERARAARERETRRPA
jgi:thioesterase domain-containing protein